MNPCHEFTRAHSPVHYSLTHSACLGSSRLGMWVVPAAPTATARSTLSPRPHPEPRLRNTFACLGWVLVRRTQTRGPYPGARRHDPPSDPGSDGRRRGSSSRRRHRAVRRPVINASPRRVPMCCTRATTMDRILLPCRVTPT
jgi:hypothetical protein